MKEEIIRMINESRSEYWVKYPNEDLQEMKKEESDFVNSQDEKLADDILLLLDKAEE